MIDFITQMFHQALLAFFKIAGTIEVSEIYFCLKHFI